MRTDLIASAAVLTLVFAGVPTAQAASPLAPFADVKCPADGRITHAQVLSVLMNGAGVKWSPELVQALTDGELGLHVRNQKMYETLVDNADILVADGPDDKSIDRISARKTGEPPSDAEKGGLGLLNRSGAQWFEVYCKPKPAEQSDDVQAPEGDGTASSWSRYWSGLIIAGTEDDAAVGDLGDRSFATFSYTDDREAEDEIVEANIFVGLPAFGLDGGPTGAFRPWVFYQRRTGDDPINDLTFGLEGEWLSKGIFASLQYETDDNLDSELHRANIDWYPSWSSFCGKTVRLNFGGSCRLYFHGDNVRVKDIGKKADLAEVDGFTRIGATLKTAWWWRLNEGGVIEARANYFLWEPIDGEVGDAAQGQVSLSWLPYKDSPYSFSVEYVEGEDPTSLVRSEALKFVFGFRR